MSGAKAERLRQARRRAGFETAASAARAFGWGEASYRHHENATRDFGPDAAKKYGRAFKVKPGWLLGLENISATATGAVASEDYLLVNAAVAAGSWREHHGWDDERSYKIDNMPSPVPNARRFGLVVEGRSMDLVFEPGTVLDCVSIFDTNVKPENGDHVIVECRRPDGLREQTVKEYLEEDGRFYLVPRSSKVEFRPMEYPGPDENHADESGIDVIGFVVAHYSPARLALFKRMGLIKPAS